MPAPRQPYGYQLCDPNVLMPETAEPRDLRDSSNSLRWSVQRSNPVERKMRAHLTVIDPVNCQ